MLDNPHYLTVTDLKQYAYCPRIVFYERCLPYVRPRTYKMDAGRDAHDDEQRLALRRSLAKYLVTGKRFFNVAVSSERLQLNGIIDEVVHTTEGEIFPVDYKLAKQASAHYRLQLATYALMLEETEAKPVSYGYLYLIPMRQMVKIKMSPVLYTQVEVTIATIHQLIEREQMPPPVSEKSRCVSCEFRRFCNDV